MATPTKPLLPPNYRNRKPRFWGATLIVMLLAVAALTAMLVASLRQNLGLVGDMNNATVQTGEFQNQIKKLSENKSAPVAAEPIAPEGKILAASPDANFILRGNESCTSNFEIAVNEKATAAATSGDTVYDLIHQVSPEDADLGSAMVRPAGKGLPEPYSFAFKNDKVMVGSIITDIASFDSPDCKVWLAEK